MKRRRVPVARRALRRTLLVMTLLAGVVAMHGVTANHDALMSMSSMTSVSAGPANAILANTEHAMQTTRAALAGPSLASADAHISASLEDPRMGAMGAACVAVLVTSLLLALLLALSRRRVSRAGWLRLSRARTTPVHTSTPSAAERPSLFELCVLRT